MAAPSGEITLDDLFGVNAFFELRNYHISIEGNDCKQPMTLGSGRQRTNDQWTAACPQQLDREDEWRDISWLVSMEDVCGNGIVDDACLGPNPPRAVGSRLSMAGGQLQCGLPSDKVYRQKVWEFKTGKDQQPIVRQAIADMLVYFVQAPSLKLVLTPFEGVAGAGPIPVKLAEPGTSAAVSLFISNNPVRQDQPLDMIPHFAAQYYLLPANTRPKDPVPLPYSVPNVPNCPQTVASSGMGHPADVVDVDLSDPNYCPMSRCFAGNWPSQSCK